MSFSRASRSYSAKDRGLALRSGAVAFACPGALINVARAAILLRFVGSLCITLTLLSAATTPAPFPVPLYYGASCARFFASKEFLSSPRLSSCFLPPPGAWSTALPTAALNASSSLSTAVIALESTDFFFCPARGEPSFCYFYWPPKPVARSSPSTPDALPSSPPGGSSRAPLSGPATLSSRSSISFTFVTPPI